jgi:hypothetical protein
MPLTPADLKSMIESELAATLDVRAVAAVRKGLVTPRPVRLNWDYGQPGEQYPGWLVFDHAAESGTCIVYCDQGFGPRCPWGLTSSKEEGGGRPMGMDCGWFPSFLDAFRDSFAGAGFLEGH